MWCGVGLCLVLGLWFSWVCVEQSSFITNILLWFFYGWAKFMVELGLCLSWVCVKQSSFITIFFYDFSVLDFWVCMVFLGLCSCVFCHFGVLNSFFFFFFFFFVFFVFLNLSLCLVLGWFWVCFCVLCVFIVFNSVFLFS